MIDPETDFEQTVTYARRIQMAALMVALIAAGSFIAIPLPGTPVPIVLQNLFVVLTGIVLPPAWALITVAVYLVMGALGLPVFAGATGGLAHFAGPTGGFLVGFAAAAAATAVVMNLRGGASGRPGRTRLVGALGLGFLLPYILGVPWLARVTGLSLPAALGAGALPFLPGDAVKAIVLYLLLRTVPDSLWRHLR
ncbi:MAG: biotin transporter BioY [Spirochaeta sp.]|jgi:biotin transport system substrate-specific component|nr:biotin transporter BioY [Spirochaeta sp.]